MGINQGSLADVEGNGITSQLNGDQRALDVGVNVGGAQVDPRDTRPLDPQTDGVTVEGSVGINGQVDVSGSSVEVTQSALPTGASTEAKQDEANASLEAIDTKLGNPLQTVGAKGVLVDQSAQVGTTSASVCPANPNRKYLIIQNVSWQRIFINFGGPAAMFTAGNILLAPGGSIQMEAGFVSTQEIFAISDGPNAPLTIKEA